MNLIKTLAVAAVVALTAGVSTPALADVETIGWDRLLPEDFTPPPVKPQAYYDANPQEDRQVSLDAPVVDELNGKDVRIPGYIVQLEGDADSVTEFLLVPYFGACIHVPPPPPNQIIHVKFDKGVPYEQTYDAVWVSGTIQTQRYEGEIAVSGYSMKASNVEVYQ